MIRLRPCDGCQRHVRVDAAACPFCRAALPEGRVPLRGAPVGRRVARAFTAAVAAVIGNGACSDDLELRDTGGLFATDAYGAPPGDARPDATPIDVGFASDAYGAPADYGPAMDVDNGFIAVDAYGASPDAMRPADDATVTDSGTVAEDAGAVDAGS